QHLDRERAADLDVLGAVDRAHRALADVRFDLVAVREDLAEEMFERFGEVGLEAHQNLPTADTVAPSGDGATIRRGSSSEVMYSTAVATAPPIATANPTSASSARTRIESRSEPVHIAGASSHEL